MTDVMKFPKTIEEFINNNSFNDVEEVYTNGSQLIQVFRVEQALEHYEQEIRNKAIEEFEKHIVAEYDNDACPNVTDYLDYRLSIRELFEIAESMKGEKE